MSLSRRATRLVLPVLAAGLALLGAAACAPTDQGGSNPSPSASTADTTAAEGGSGDGTTDNATCTKADLKTQTPGVFTVATDNPAYPPWFIDDKPSNGKGYESAVAYAVAKKLGYTRSEVKWVTASFNSVIAPGPKKFDVDINQVSISPARKKAVDFSSGYYDVRQVIVTYKGSKIADAKSIADLKDALLGAQVGTTSYTALIDQIDPSQKPRVYDTNDLAVQALKNHAIDGVVVDLPTGFYMASAQLKNGVIVGTLPLQGKPEQFGMVLDKGSPLTSCVSQAVDALRKDGTLAKLEKKWLSNAGAPELS